SAGSARLSPAAVLGAGVGVVVAGIGFVAARPDVVVIAFPLLLSAVLAMTARPSGDAVITLTSAVDQTPGRVRDDIHVDTGTEMVHLHVTQAERTTDGIIVPGRGTVRADSRVQHSGPLEALRVTARTLDQDAMLLGQPGGTQYL